MQNTMTLDETMVALIEANDPNAFAWEPSGRYYDNESDDNDGPATTRCAS